MKFAAILVLASFATVANAGVYTGSSGVIPDSVNALNPGLFRSSIAISGDIDYPITAVTLELQQFSHTFIGDIVVTLRSPNNTVHTIMSRVGLVGSNGGDSSNVRGNYLFADGGADLWAAAAAVGNTATIAPGTYSTTSARSPVATSMNAAFAGQNSNGLWTLTITDNAVGDVGGILGWRLTIIPAPGALALAGVGVIVAARRKRR